MNHLELLLYLSALSLEVTVCGLVCLRNVFRPLPVFSVYVFVLLTCDVVSGLLAYHWSYRSASLFYASWALSGVSLAARCLAVAELCHYKLRAYQGIWKLTWRILVLLALAFVAHGAVDAWNQPSRMAIYVLTIGRDAAIASLVILIWLLLIYNYYDLSFEPLQMWVAVGMTFLSTVVFLNDTFLRDNFTGYLSFWFFTKYMSLWPQVKSQVEGATELWNVIRSASFLLTLGIWSFALRKPLPAPKREPQLLPAEIYAKVSPAVNLRLRAINDRLLELLKP